MFPLVLAAIDSIEEPSERDLVEGLFLDYANYVYSIASNILGDHHSAESAVSDVFLKVIKNRRKFIDIERKKVVSLLAIYTRHSCYNIKKRWVIENKIFDITVSSDNNFEEFADALSVESDYVDRETVAEIKKIISNLPYPNGDMLILKVFHSYTSTEISEVFGINPSTVRNIISRAKADVAERLERSGLC